MDFEKNIHAKRLSSCRQQQKSYKIHIEEYKISNSAKNADRKRRLGPTVSKHFVRFICGCVWDELKFHFTMSLDRFHLDAHLFSLDNGRLRDVHRVCMCDNEYETSAKGILNVWLFACIYVSLSLSFLFFWHSSYFNSFWLPKMPSFVNTAAICNRSSSKGGQLFKLLLFSPKSAEIKPKRRPKRKCIT